MYLRRADRDLSDIYASIYKETRLVKEAKHHGIETIDISKEEFLPIKIRLEKAKDIVRSKARDVGFVLDRLKTLLTFDKAKCKTMQVYRSGKILINVEFMMDDLDLDQTAFVLAHEAAHIMNRTFEREKGRNPYWWNIATDYAMNLSLMIAGFKMPTIGCLPKEINGEYFIIEPAPFDTPFNIDDARAEDIYTYFWKKIKGNPPPPTPTNPQPPEGEEEEGEGEEGEGEGEGQGGGQEEEINVGDLVRDQVTKKVHRVLSIDANDEIDVGPELSKEEIKKHKNAGGTIK